jgi:hypothetical protein
MDLTKNKNLLYGAGAVILIAVGYFVFFSGGSSAPDVAATAPASPAELLFINLAGELDPVSFNGGILTDPRFTALTDIRTAVLPETTGRTDPFAPLGK